MSEQSPQVLGIDIGGTKILAAVVAASGEVLGRGLLPTPEEPGEKEIIRAVCTAARNAARQAGVDFERISGVGLGVAGVSDPAKGILHTSPNLPGLRDFPICRAITKELSWPSFLINDANAAALAEHRWGAAKNVRHFVYITVSTGIGGGIIINGELYTGASGAAGEIGHMTIDVNGPACNCGNHGCWETLASGTALARRAREEIASGAKTAILELAGGDIDSVKAEHVSRAASGGDALAGELITQTGRYLGVGFANLINLFNPELIVIGGGLANIGEPLLKPAYEEAKARAFTRSYEAVSFVPAALGVDSGVLGAAAEAMTSLGIPF